MAQPKAGERGQRRTNLAVIEWLLEGGCFVCHEKDTNVLQFDHIRGDKTRETQDSRASVGSWRGMRHFARAHNWPEFYDEILKCDVVCANCHARRTAARYRSKAALQELVRQAKGIDSA